MDPTEGDTQAVDGDEHDKEIIVDPKEGDGIDGTQAAVVGDIEAGESPSSKGTPRSDDDDDDKPLVAAKKPLVAAKKDEGTAADEDEAMDMNVDEDEEEHKEVDGAPAIEFRKGRLTTFLRVVQAGEAKNLISQRCLLGIKNTPADRIVITREGESVTGVLLAERWYIVTVAAKPKAKAKGKAKSKATAKSEAAPEPAAKAVAKAVAKSRAGRKPLDVPECVINNLVDSEEADMECHRYIQRLYKAVKNDASCQEKIDHARGLRKLWVQQIGAGIVVDDARRDIDEVTQLLDKAVRVSARVSGRVGQLAEAFPCGPRDTAPKKARTA